MSERKKEKGKKGKEKGEEGEEEEEGRKSMDIGKGKQRLERIERKKKEDWKLAGRKIEQVESYKYLGMEMENNPLRTQMEIYIWGQLTTKF